MASSGQQLHISLVLWAPGLDAVLQVRSHKGIAEDNNPLPHPANKSSFDAAQGRDASKCTYCWHMHIACASTNTLRFFSTGLAVLFVYKGICGSYVPRDK